MAGWVQANDRNPKGNNMATLHLVEGPVGAGKPTFAGQLSLVHEAPCLVLDEWMVTLYSPDRPNTGFMERVLSQ